MSFARELSEVEMQKLGRSIDFVTQLYSIPRPVMYALYLQEGGWPGARIEIGGSADIGIFQINTSEENWLPIIKRELDLDESAVQWSILGNTMAAGYILKVEYARTGSWIQAMGNYHRHKQDAARDRYLAGITGYLTQLKMAQEQMAMFSEMVRTQTPHLSLAHRTAGINFE
ncbi:hypothetical protein [Reinekea sp. G2M2-21]|uniref:hypothetical protein n=1 Tax=Reinekea sp. G2M2-21 TaxID=2788942 RepID=UPI0018AB2276|nr:hypothetical protein [Reinekea sp. G2M2-21]